jgi:hypothetical protein
MLAGSDRGQIPRPMQAVGQRVVDRLDFRVGQQLSVRTQHSLHPMLRGERLGATWIPCRDRDQPDPGESRGIHDRAATDAGRAEHAHAQRFHGIRT